MRRRTLTLIGFGLLFLAVLSSSHRRWTRLAPGPPALEQQPARHTQPDRSRPNPSGLPAPPAYRLANTDLSPSQLSKSQNAILLETAVIDTTRALPVIPKLFQSQTAPGAYIVQASTATDAAFRRVLETGGASIVSYVPNNAYLVRATELAAERLRSAAGVRAVLRYEPYYKIKPSLLKLVLAGFTQTDAAPPAELSLNAVCFADSTQPTEADLSNHGIESTGADGSPFGPVLRLRCPLRAVPWLAGWPAIQELELQRSRLPANDLTRPALGISIDPVIATNYLDLTGSNILVAVNDTGVDTNQADLAGRVLFDVPFSGVDSNGHGTHVAGVIAGSGGQSLTVTNSIGSPLPPAEFQFRGQAPGAQIFSIRTDLSQGPAESDSYLQQTAANAHAAISEHSWAYDGDNEYDIAAASYDAAVRDSLSSSSGPQPLLYVFAAGNRGAGSDAGDGGSADSIQSPATAKNVLTVGALEHFRTITNTVVQCVEGTNGTECATNQPWLGQTDSAGQVAAFSSRGNVGIGIEGEFGRFKPDVVAPGTFVVSSRSSTWDEVAYYAPTNIGSAWSDYFDVLRALNDDLGPFYRYESGTSMSAAAAAGTLALMQEFFEQRLAQTNSPALMKALLINGARGLDSQYDFACASPTNFQGWGLINLTNSIPAAWTNASANCGPVLTYDQSDADSLATGLQQTRVIALSDPAREQDLRVTLVWTDPPANPVVGIKLVNDLDLVVTNLDTGEVFYGNDFARGTNWTRPFAPGASGAPDSVNNVENVFLAPPLSTNYSISVAARRVSVNAVTTQTNAVAQDYALVISSGNGQVPDAITLANTTSETSNISALTLVTNQFTLSTNDSGVILTAQRAGAHNPATDSLTVPLAAYTNAQLSIGDTNQWQFYAITNESGFSNAIFLTFAPQRLAPGPTEAQRRSGTLPAPDPGPALGEADIDLYVSQDPALTNLDPAAISAADKSLSRGGRETLLYSNAIPAVYYAAVKCESASAAEFGFAAISSELPFAETDYNNNQVLRGFPAPTSIPAASARGPGTVQVFAFSPAPMSLHRVIVTNVISHESPVDLVSTLEHLGHSVTLNAHPTNSAATNTVAVYDDSLEMDIPEAQPTAGPGSLRDFGGTEAAGQYLLTVASTNLPGTNESFSLFLERQAEPLSGAMATLLPGACDDEFLTVAPGTTNLEIGAYLVSGEGPVSLQAGPVTASAETPPLDLSTENPSGTVEVNRFTIPALTPGLWRVRLCNSGTNTNQVSLTAVPALDPNPMAPARFRASAPLAIADDAVSVSTVHVTNRQTVVAAEVGVRVIHPRLSDLALTLISPSGTRVLLAENRGGTSSAGAGFDTMVTNVVPVSSDGGPEASTNLLDTGLTSGVVNISYDFYSLPDEMHIYYQGNLIFDSGLVSDTGTYNVSYGPGTSTSIQIVMNEGGNYDPNTAWRYVVTSSHLEPIYLAFTEDTNLTTTPIKFALPPFDQLPPGADGADAIYYLPEQSLATLAGETASGDWKLEVRDTRAGAADPLPALQSWQLKLVLADRLPTPIPLGYEERATNSVPAGQVQWYAIAVPAWASFATNSLLAATAPVNLLFNQTAPPTGTNAGDHFLLTGLTSGGFTLETNSTPPLVPGAIYYVGLQNTNPAAVDVAFAVDFDLTALSNGAILSNCLSVPERPRYFYFDVSTNATAVSFQLTGLSGNVDLVASLGLPLPTLNTFLAGSFNPSTNDEAILMLTNSGTLLLTPGRWYLGVFDQETNSATYNIQAVEYTEALPPITTLWSGVPFDGNLPAVVDSADFYRFVVSTNAVRAQFEVNHPTGDVALVARKGLPLPTLASYDLLSSNLGTNDELLVIEDSTPVPLSPGEWFLSVVNLYGEPIAYSILAQEWAAAYLPLQITQQAYSAESFCLAWNSLAGVHYVVEATPSLSPPAWVAVSPTITAADALTSWCLPLPSEYHFFRVREGLALSTQPAPVHIKAINVDTNGTLLQWNAPAQSQFLVEWTASLEAPLWNAFTNMVSSTNTDFSFLDDTQPPGGSELTRYFRLVQQPP